MAYVSGKPMRSIEDYAWPMSGEVSYILSAAYAQDFIGNS